jgi:hypothetical protein
MSVNKFQPHLQVLPEDDANRQLANGFWLEVNSRQIQVLPEVGGWLNVCEAFVSEHVAAMRVYPHRHLVLLLDFDDDVQRPDWVKAKIPDDLKDRVFVLGVQSEPEALKRAGLGTFESIGQKMASECRDGVQGIWEHELLQQNAGEVSRLAQAVCNFLF